MNQQFLPLLKPDNIEELKALILQIMEDNDIKLESIIDNQQNQKLQQNDQFTIDDLNQILTNQCLQRQKVITNLSHFALSLMSTIRILWQDNEDLEYKIKDEGDMIDHLNENLMEASKEIQFLKGRLQIFYNDFHRVQEEKQAIESYLNEILLKQESGQYKKNISSLIVQCNFKSKDPQILSEEIQKATENFFIQQERQFPQEHSLFQEEQQSLSMIEAEKHYDQTENQNHLLQQSIIKDSISVLKNFTLSEEVQNNFALNQENETLIKFIPKNQRLSLINQFSLQISDQNLPVVPSEDNLLQVSVGRDLRISKQKINITIATGTQFTKTKDQQKQDQFHFSAINPSSSCNSLLLNRQNSAIMYPVLQRSTSSMSFVFQSTKHVQADLPEIKATIKKQFKKIQKKNIGVDTTKEKQLQTDELKINKQTTPILPQVNTKSFSQIFTYFTKKIVSDRIKAHNKKNDTKGFKKSKSIIQKVL